MAVTVTATTAWTSCCWHDSVVDTSYGARDSRRCVECGSRSQGVREVNWWQIRRRWQERKRQAAIEAFKNSIFNADLGDDANHMSWWRET